MKTESGLLRQVQAVMNDEQVPYETKTLIRELTSDHLTLALNRKQGDGLAEEIIPDMERIKYQGALKRNAACEENHVEGGLSEEQARTMLRQHLIQGHSTMLMNITDSDLARLRVKEAIRRFCTEQGIRIQKMDREETQRFLIEDVLDYGIITGFVYDHEGHEFEEIRINDYDDIRYVQKGKEHRAPMAFESPEQVLALAQKICRNSGGKIVNKDVPFVRARLGNNIRVSMMIDPVARRSDSSGRVVQMVVRKQNMAPFSRQFLIESGTISEEGFNLIEMLMRYGASMNFYGGTNSGKTGTLSAFVNEVFSDNDTRVITIAEIDEMNLRKIDEVTGTAVNNALMWEIKQGFSFRHAVNASLTFTPETLILQETKGEEIVDVIDAAITGHQLLTSSHAKNINVFAKRMLGMYKQSGSDLSDDLILEYVTEAFDVLVRMKIYRDGRRRISEISELISYDRIRGSFEVNQLMTFQIDEVEAKRVYQHERGMVETRSEMTGHHQLINPISSRLRNLLLENGMPSGLLESMPWGMSGGRADG